MPERMCRHHTQGPWHSAPTLTTSSVGRYSMDMMQCISARSLWLMTRVLGMGASMCCVQAASAQGSRARHVRRCWSQWPW